MFINHRIKLFYYLTERGTLRTNRIASHHIQNLTTRCTFCNLETEMIKHLFWECTIAKRFIDQVILHMNNVHPGYYVGVDVKQFIFINSAFMVPKLSPQV